ncbi:MAG: GNAT family N-acetyltransferase [Phycisphaerales bacterium]
MHKIGLKLWSINKNYFDEAKRLFEEGFYDYIELYAVPDSLELIDFWKKLQVPYVIHGPHFRNGLNFADPQKKDDNIKLAHQAIKFANALNAEYIIFHPGVDGSIEETARQLSKIKDSRILIENKPYLGFGNVICTGNLPEEIEFIMKQCNVGFCLDIGHAICAANSHKIEYISFLKEFIKLEPTMYHLSDGDLHGEFDSHEHFGQGKYNLDELISLLPSSAMVSIETKKDSEENLTDFVKDANFFRNINKQMLIRKARESDLMAVYNLNNSPEVRMQSISRDRIELEDHKNWFKGKLENDKVKFYIVESYAGKFVGQVRFDLLESEQWLISIAINSEYRGKGLGTWTITKASRMVQIACDLPVVAYIKKNNESSKRAFVKAGFVSAAEETIKAEFFHRLELQPLIKRHG